MKKARNNWVWESGKKGWLDKIVDQKMLYLETGLFFGGVFCWLRPRMGQN